MPFPTDHILAYSVATGNGLAREIVADIKQSISTDCPRYHLGQGGHSPGGSPPYKESGVLEKSITPLVTSTPDGVSVTVYTKTRYARTLEYGGQGTWGYVSPRPFMGPARDRWTPQVVNRFQNIPPIP